MGSGLSDCCKGGTTTHVDHLDRERNADEPGNIFVGNIATDASKLSPEAFVENLVRRSESVANLQGNCKVKGVKINIDLIETVLLADEEDILEASREVASHDCQATGLKRISDRKGTGFVTPNQIGKAVDHHVQFETEAAEVKKTRASTRKGTGFVTKEKLLLLLNEVGEDEDGEVSPEILAKADAKDDGRKKQRKGTGFVTKKALAKVLASVDDEEE
eukprot:TRINITY_DN68905_c0_g1_i1.p1 TRINITY_DN68905_c0_g1~~TRINITY_DN68905_c0_g1_i1.p1  ORF type:complete len:218 (-),score=43.53 TRINITY_DN68905_c0_g1_i1:84-737(-)